MFKSKMAILVGAMAVSGVASADLDTGLVAYWNFDDCTAKDITGNLPDGKLSNMTCSDGVMQFNGANSYIEIPENPLLDFDSSVTFVAKINPALNGKHHWIFRKSTCVGSPYFFGINVQDEVNLTINDVSGTWLDGASIKAGWRFVVGVYDGTSRKLYVDGAKKAEFTNVSGPIRNVNGPLYIGHPTCSGNNDFFLGEMDELRLYNRALTATEVKTLY